MSSTLLNVGIVGATGAVGKEIVGVLEKRSFPVGNLRIFGSERSAGKNVDTKFGKVTVELFCEDTARECDVVFLAVDGDFSLAHAENICAGSDGAVVIDNSSAFRYKEGIPLVVPEINAEATKGKKLIANPNCTTAIGLMAIWPLHKLFGLKKMVMSVRSNIGFLFSFFHAFRESLCANLSFPRHIKLPPEQVNPAWMN